MEKNSMFNDTVDTLCKGMNGFVSTKTVVGDPIVVGDTMIVPLVNVSFGLAAGALAGEKKRNSGGGMGGKLTPTAVLVIKDGMTRMISVERNSGVEKILDMVPDFVDKFAARVEGKKQDPDARERAKEKMEEMLDDAVADVETEEDSSSAEDTSDNSTSENKTEEA